MTYLVLEVHSSYAVLLDEAGRFQKAANLNYAVGQTITEPVLWNPPRLSLPIKRLGGMIALVACLLLAIAIPQYQIFMTPDTTMTVQINPSIDVTLNKNSQVIQLTPHNSDAEDLLHGYRAKGKSYLTVTEELIARATTAGYLKNSGRITISIDAPTSERFQSYDLSLRDALTKQLADRPDIQIEIRDKNAPPAEPAPPAASAAPATSVPTETPSTPKAVHAPTTTPTPAPVSPTPQPAPTYSDDVDDDDDDFDDDAFDDDFYEDDDEYDD